MRAFAMIMLSLVLSATALLQTSEARNETAMIVGRDSFVEKSPKFVKTVERECNEKKFTKKIAHLLAVSAESTATVKVKVRYSFVEGAGGVLNVSIQDAEHHLSQDAFDRLSKLVKEYVIGRFEGERTGVSETFSLQTPWFRSSI